MNKTFKHLILILIVALIPRLVWFSFAGSWRDDVLQEKILVSDAGGYHRIAVNLLEHQTFSDSAQAPFEPNTTRTPLYPLFLTVTYAVFGVHPFVAILLQIVISGLTCLMIYKTGELLDAGEGKVALIAGLIFALDYSSVAHANALLSDTLFVLLFSICIWFTAKFLLEDTRTDLIWSAIFLGLSTLCRPVTVYFFVFLLGAFLLRFRKDWKSGLGKYATLTGLFILSVMPWTIRNSMVSGRFVVSSQQADVLRWNSPNLVQFVNNSRPPSTEERSGVRHSIWRDLKGYPPGLMRFFLTPGSNQILDAFGLPNKELKRDDSRKGSQHMLRTALESRGYLGVFLILLLISYLLLLYSTAAIGAWAVSKSPQAILVVLFITILAYFAIASGRFSWGDRYRLPIMPYIILLSSYAIVFLRSARVRPNGELR